MPSAASLSLPSSSAAAAVSLSLTITSLKTSLQQLVRHASINRALEHSISRRNLSSPSMFQALLLGYIQKHRGASLGLQLKFMTGWHSPLSSLTLLHVPMQSHPWSSSSTAVDKPASPPPTMATFSLGAPCMRKSTCIKSFPIGFRKQAVATQGPVQSCICKQVRLLAENVLLCEMAPADGEDLKCI